MPCASDTLLYQRPSIPRCLQSDWHYRSESLRHEVPSSATYTYLRASEARADAYVVDALLSQFQMLVAT